MTKKIKQLQQKIRKLSHPSNELIQVKALEMVSNLENIREIEKIKNLELKVFLVGIWEFKKSYDAPFGYSQNQIIEFEYT